MSLAALVGAAAAAAALDQASKYLALRRLCGREGQPLPVTGLRLVRHARLGALGLGDAPAVVTWIAVVAALALLVIILPSSHPGSASGLATGLGLALGGATSNLADRLVRGCVVDFIVVWRWPTFNLADAAIVVGAAVVAGSLL